MKHLVILIVWSFIGTARSRLRRLKDPRYAIPAALAGGYFAMLLWSGTFGPGAGEEIDIDLSWLEHVAGIGLLAMFTSAWIVPSKSPLKFTEAEVQLLFPAPLSRRNLIDYRLMKMVLLSGVSALFVSVFVTKGWDLIRWLQNVTGLWTVFVLASLHGTAVSLTRKKLGGRLWAQALMFLVPAAVALLVLHTARTVTLPHGMEPLEIVAAIRDRVSSGAVGWALTPFRTAASLILVDDLRAAAAGLLTVGAFSALHYVWIHGLDVSFEDEAVAEAPRLAARLQAARSRGLGGGNLSAVTRRVRGTRLPLRNHGPVWTAVVWKNLVAFTRSGGTWLVLGALLTPVAAVLLYTLGKPPDAALAVRCWVGATIMLSVAGYFVLFAPSMLKNDLRDDLRRMDLIKVLPLGSVDYLRGQVWGMSLAAWAVTLSMSLPGLALIAGVPDVDAGLIAFGAALGLIPAALAPILCAFTTENGVAVMVPSWIPGVKEGADAKTGGFENIGMTMASLIVRGVTMTLLLLPPAAIAVPIAVFGWVLIGPAVLVLSGLIALAVTVAEVELALRWLAGAFDRLDPSAEGL